MSENTFTQIAFHGRDWALMKQYLEEEKRIAVHILCSDCGIEEVHKVRGRLVFIEKMLHQAEYIIKEQNKSR